MTSEFDRIARYFAPLAGPEGLGLLDDAALFSPEPGEQLVLTKDAMVEGVHFRAEDAAGLIARKLQRVNLSDLAAKGARPVGYLLATAFPPEMTDEWIAAYAAGLAEDQAAFGWQLLGGDTVSTPGPLTLSLTAIGAVAEGAMIPRRGAKAGDALFVTGTIGDAFLGLAVLEEGLASDAATFLAERYLLPQPRLGVGAGLVGLANAGLDVSDGLVADAAHLGEASGLGVEIDVDAVPLSEAAASLVADGRVERTELITGGDDYELCFAAPVSARTAISDLARAHGLPITEIGRFSAGDGVIVRDHLGGEISLSSMGYDHFSR